MSKNKPKSQSWGLIKYMKSTFLKKNKKKKQPSCEIWCDLKKLGEKVVKSKMAANTVEPQLSRPHLSGFLVINQTTEITALLE